MLAARRDSELARPELLAMFQSQLRVDFSEDDLCRVLHYVAERAQTHINVKLSKSDGTPLVELMCNDGRFKNLF